jgi:hypothetical protein
LLLGAHPRGPFEPGPYPVKQKQWQTMAQVVAELCQFYRIPATPQTVLGHGEVERILAVHRKNKWDPRVLPWAPTLSRSEVDDAFRHLAAQYMVDVIGQDEEGLPEVCVNIGRRQIPAGIVANQGFCVKVAPVVDEHSWPLYNTFPDDPEMVSRTPEIPAQILVRGMRDGSFRPRHKLGQ